MGTTILLVGLLISNACHTETSIMPNNSQGCFFACILICCMIADVIEFFAKLIRKYGN